MVDSPSLRKALETVYVVLLPKNSHPFIYLRYRCALYSKKTSILLSHCSIIIVPENIDVNVHPTKHQVQFLHEDLIIETVQKSVEEGLLSSTSSRTYYTQSLLPSVSDAQAASSVSVKDTKTYDYKMVRTDSKEKKLDAFIHSKPLADVPSGNPFANSDQVHRKQRKLIHLTSVLSLQSEIRKGKHKG